jgi:hypothetical protein
VQAGPKLLRLVGVTALMRRKRTSDRDDEMPALTAEQQAAQAELEALLAAQGVGPTSSIAELRGDFWPEDEDPDEFLATIRAWREGRDAPASR